MTRILLVSHDKDMSVDKSLSLAETICDKFPNKPTLVMPTEFYRVKNFNKPVVMWNPVFMRHPIEPLINFRNELNCEPAIALPDKSGTFDLDEIMDFNIHNESSQNIQYFHIVIFTVDLDIIKSAAHLSGTSLLNPYYAIKTHKYNAALYSPESLRFNLEQDNDIWYSNSKDLWSYDEEPNNE